MPSTACESRARCLRSNAVRLLLAAFALLALVAIDAAHADDLRRRRDDLDVVVPVDPHEHERLHWFGRDDHHVVPGAVTINRAPYVCDVEGKEFRRRDAFVAHLRLVHRLPPDRIRELVVLTGGQVRFPGED
jgi:hypothetical protein